MELKEILQLLSIVVGLIVAIIPIYKNSKIKKAEFIYQLYSKFDNKDYQEIYYKIIDLNFVLKNAEDEKKLDNLLGFFDYISYLYYNSKLLNKKDIEY
ncbi:MAG: hypothetical protein KA885_10245, partial [Spirochaetes bacterium]|nr:hypothetical protein [Spirochaetota bacterium]